MNKMVTLTLIIYICLITSCKKFLDVGEPRDKATADFVFQDDASAAAVLTGIYYDLQSSVGIAHGSTNISLISGLLADECNLFDGNHSYRMYYVNNDAPNYWSPLFDIIYRVNRVLEGIASSQKLSDKVRAHLEGEAKFLRAFSYFYLVNFYGDVPLLTNSDLKKNASAPRTSLELVYRSIINDLLSAQSLLSEDYLNADASTITMERIRPNKWAATALLSRTYLYSGEWKKAEDAASELIANKNRFDTVSLDKVFLKTSKEAIWQLQTLSDYGSVVNTNFARLFFLADGEPNIVYPIWVGDSLLNAFEESDRRMDAWLGVDSSSGKKYYYFFKYKEYKPEAPLSEYIMVFRLGEQYLIRASARANQNNISGGLADLNLIRDRAGLKPHLIVSKNVLLDAIVRERRVELFMEWGDRWLELKRTGLIDNVMNNAAFHKGSDWKSYKQLFPIPIDDLRYNGNLVQNNGYPSL